MGCTAARPRPLTTPPQAHASKLDEKTNIVGAAAAAENSKHSVARHESKSSEKGPTRNASTSSFPSQDNRPGRSTKSWVRDDMGFKAHLAKVHNFVQLERKYELGTLIGEGITGQVRVVTSRIDGGVYAMKSLNVGKMDDSQLQELKAEIEMLKILDHPNVVSLIEIFESENNICLVMDYCRGGDLNGRRFKSENDLASVLHQILQAIAHCHHFGVIHRDLKLENVMFREKESDRLQLIDFGLSKSFFSLGSELSLEKLNDKSRAMETVCGTICYMAPEVLTKKYSEKADLWALGIIAYTLMTGAAPFQAKDDAELLRMVKRGYVVYDEGSWKRLSPIAKQFVQSLLVSDPDERVSAKDALHLPWMVEFRRKRDAAAAAAIDVEFAKKCTSCLLRSASYPLLRKAALMVISYHMRDQEKSRLQKLFNSLDESFTGELTIDDLYRMIQLYGDPEQMPMDKFKILFDQFDQDRSGYIHHMEFLSATVEAVVIPTKKVLDHAFEHLDADSSGFISVENVQDLLGGRYTLEDAEKIIRVGFESIGTVVPDKLEISREHFIRMMEEVGFSFDSASIAGTEASNSPGAMSLSSTNSPVQTKMKVDGSPLLLNESKKAPIVTSIAKDSPEFELQTNEIQRAETKSQ